MTWYSAIDYCNTLTLYVGGDIGYFADDWRLANVKELQSLIDYGENDPALPAVNPFIEVQSSNYWSSTIDDSNIPITTFAWAVNFHGGSVSTGAVGNCYAWCVRGGDL